MTALADDLRAARKLIERPEAWTKGSYCLDAAGNEDLDHIDDAVCFCALGAIRRVTRSNDASAAAMALKAVIAAYSIGRLSVSDWNDARHRTHAEVLAAFDKAIALAEGRGGGE